MANSNGGWSPGNIKPGGWLVILAILFAIYWYGVKPYVNVGSVLSHIPANSTSTAPSAGTQSADIIILTTGTKKGWLTQEIAKFNAQSTTGHASLDVLESRDGLQKILAGAEQPALWSPSSTVWTDRLAQIGPSNGITINFDNADLRTLFQSPLVFLVAKSKLAELTPILTSRHPFDELARSGAYKFAYANPLKASSGMLTMSLLLTEYADIHNSDDLDAVSKSAGFASWLSRVDNSLDRQNIDGSSQLESDFETDPGDRAFITTYESSALAATINNPDLAIVYPNPTTNATQVIAIVHGPWLTDAKRATATAFLDFITSDAANSDALTYYFRPAFNGGPLLGQKVAGSAAASYFHDDFRTTDLPSYDAINNANVIWYNQQR